jgi:hypothetical protein
MHGSQKLTLYTFNAAATLAAPWAAVFCKGFAAHIAGALAGLRHPAIALCLRHLLLLLPLVNFLRLLWVSHTPETAGGEEGTRGEEGDANPCHYVVVPQESALPGCERRHTQSPRPECDGMLDIFTRRKLALDFSPATQMQAAFGSKTHFPAAVFVAQPGLN